MLEFWASLCYKGKRRSSREKERSDTIRDVTLMELRAPSFRAGNSLTELFRMQ